MRLIIVIVLLAFCAPGLAESSSDSGVSIKKDEFTGVTEVSTGFINVNKPDNPMLKDPLLRFHYMALIENNSLSKAVITVYMKRPYFEDRTLNRIDFIVDGKRVNIKRDIKSSKEEDEVELTDSITTHFVATLSDLSVLANGDSIRGRVKGYKFEMDSSHQAIITEFVSKVSSVTD